ncbi:MAG: cisA [Bacilli bacterium]|nr:cisA [Bacilli bacterium]
MYCGVYPRVSTGLQVTDGTSLEGQVELCIRKAKELGFSESNIKIYKEEGFSGEDIDRPALNQLRYDVALGTISHVIITHPDRLSRDLTDKLFICREFESRDVELVFVDTEYKNTPEGHLFFNLMSVIAQYELSLIKKRTVRGRLKAVEKDKKIMPMRVPSYGYDFIEQKLLINEKEAEFVKQIYGWYVYDNLTLREIGNKLYKLGAIPKRAESKNWCASSIQRILTSEVYIGKYYYNRRSTRKIKGERTITGAPKKTYEFRDEKDWLCVEVPSIIDVELFKLAQLQRLKNTKKSGNIKYEYLLKSLLRCGHCGRTWQSTTYSGREDKETGKRVPYTCYRCPNLFPTKYGNGIVACSSRSIRTERLDEFVWELILNVISDPKEYVERLQINEDSVINEIKHAADLIQKQIQQKDKELEKVKIMFKQDVIDENELALEFVKINVVKRELGSELTKYNMQISDYKEFILSAERITEISEQIKRFIDQAGKKLSFADKRHIVESLVDEIRITCEGDEVQITALGYLDELKRGKIAHKDNDIVSCTHPQKIRQYR